MADQNSSAEGGGGGGEEAQRTTGEEAQRHASERRVSHAPTEEWSNLDEYGRLVKYASTYREPGAVSAAQDEEVQEKRVWYAPWKKRRVRVKKADLQTAQYPQDWLTTDIHHGLPSTEVHHRRGRSGWNELVSEKENPIAKLLSYFQGPILYGEEDIRLRFLSINWLIVFLSHGAGRPSCRGYERLDRFWCHYWYLVS